MPRKLQRQVAAARPKQTPAARDRKDGPRLPALGGRRVSPKLLAEFTNQLAVLLDAGIPVTKCLRILEGQIPPGAMRRTLEAVVEEVESGTSLSEAMAKHPAVFDRLYTNMVRAGEAGGVQEEILNRLALFMEKSESIKSRVKGALAYPVAVLGVAVLVLALVFIYVIPKFKDIFRNQFGEDEMPPLTQGLINFAEHLEVYWWAYLVGIVAIYSLHRLLIAKVDGYRAARDRLMLRIPVFGALLNKSLVARFSRTFGTLIQSGVPHLEALEIVGGSVNNVRLVDAVDQIHGSIREGAGIAVPMGESGIFDDVVVNMVDVGEQTGELDRMLSKIADRYETEVDRSIETTFKVIEPILLVVLAVIVGVIVLALFTPLLKIMDKLS
ncbi:MAG: type II secretion system F family protein [Planctomycetota bacterium]